MFVDGHSVALQWSKTNYERHESHHHYFFFKNIQNMKVEFKVNIEAIFCLCVRDFKWLWSNDIILNFHVWTDIIFRKKKVSFKAKYP